MTFYGRTGRFHGNRYRFSLKLPYLSNYWRYKVKFYTKITRKPMFISALKRKFISFRSEKSYEQKCNFLAFFTTCIDIFSLQSSKFVLSSSSILMQCLITFFFSFIRSNFVAFFKQKTLFKIQTRSLY